MADSLTIDEVVRRTGLTARTLRYYEARGLLHPLRTASGRRCFGACELERIHRITLFKRAGFSLAAIARLIDGARIEPLVRLQLAQAEQRLGEVQAAIGALRLALGHIEQGTALDAAMLCELINHGERMMQDKQAWEKLGEQYFSDTAKADFARAPYPAGFDQNAYAAQWAELGARIKAALPLDPGSATAQALLAEWKALLAPFTAIATPAMAEGVKAMYGAMPSWPEGSPSPGFDHAVWQFITAAGEWAKRQAQ